MKFILKHLPPPLRVENCCHTCVVRPPRLTAACLTPLPSSTFPIRAPPVSHQNRRRHTLTISRPRPFRKSANARAHLSDRRHSWARLSIDTSTTLLPAAFLVPNAKSWPASTALPLNRDFAHRFRAKQCCAAFANANDQNFDYRLTELTTLAPIYGGHVQGLTSHFLHSARPYGAPP